MQLCHVTNDEKDIYKTEAKISVHNDSVVWKMVLRKKHTNAVKSEVSKGKLYRRVSAQYLRVISNISLHFSFPPLSLLHLHLVPFFHFICQPKFCSSFLLECCKVRMPFLRQMRRAELHSMSESKIWASVSDIPRLQSNLCHGGNNRFFHDITVTSFVLFKLLTIALSFSTRIRLTFVLSW